MQGRAREVMGLRFESSLNFLMTTCRVPTLFSSSVDLSENFATNDSIFLKFCRNFANWL